MKRDLIESMYRRDFIAFVEFAFRIVHPRKTLKPSWHHDIIAEHLEGCRAGQLPRLIINAPPRSLKSFIASVAFPAFALGQNPMMQIMSIVANQELAGEILDKLERLMSAAGYRSLFPHIQIKRTRNSIGTSHGGSFKSTPLYTSPIGRGADLIILDDPMSSTDALNERSTKAAFDWLTSEVFSRLNEKASAPIILVMQRLSHHDLTARCSDWHTLRITAIAREPEVHRLPDISQPWTRPARDVLSPEIESLETLSEIYCQIGHLEFSAQYLQDPIQNQWINARVYYDYDATNWSVDGPQPEFKCMFSVAVYIRWECFGVGPKPPYNWKCPITPAQEQARIVYSQAKLMEEAAEDCF